MKINKNIFVVAMLLGLQPLCSTGSPCFDDLLGDLADFDEVAPKQLVALSADLQVRASQCSSFDDYLGDISSLEEAQAGSAFPVAYDYDGVPLSLAVPDDSFWRLFPTDTPEKAVSAGKSEQFAQPTKSPKQSTPLKKRGTDRSCTSVISAPASAFSESIDPACLTEPPACPSSSAPQCDMPAVAHVKVIAHKQQLLGAVKQVKEENNDEDDGNNAKRFRCTICSYQTNKKSNIFSHQRIHTGEKPYKCGKCDSAFAHLSSYTRHQYIHGGEKPYVCEVCGSAFTQLSTLADHKHFHSGIKPYACQECGSAFTTSSNLLRHQIIHSGEKPYVCTECGSAFTQAGNLNRHKKNMHG